MLRSLRTWSRYCNSSLRACLEARGRDHDDSLSNLRLLLMCSTVLLYLRSGMSTYSTAGTEVPFYLSIWSSVFILLELGTSGRTGGRDKQSQASADCLFFDCQAYKKFTTCYTELDAIDFPICFCVTKYAIEERGII